jgi:hypothetical protein
LHAEKGESEEEKEPVLRLPAKADLRRGARRRYLADIVIMCVLIRSSQDNLCKMPCSDSRFDRRAGHLRTTGPRAALHHLHIYLGGVNSCLFGKRRGEDHMVSEETNYVWVELHR